MITAFSEQLITIDELRTRMPDLRARETNLRNQIQAIDAQTADRGAYLKLAQDLTGFLSQLRRATDTTAIPERQRILRLLIKDILVGPEQITIRHHIPIRERTPTQPGDTDTEGDPTSDCPLRWGRDVPLLSNVALTVLDEHIAQHPGGPASSKLGRAQRRGRGLPNIRLVRFADDWCLMVHGTKADAEHLREDIAEVLSTMGLRLSPEKTLITHIDEGLDFLGWRIQRHRKPGASKRYVYTYPARKSVKAVTGKVKTLCRRMDTSQPLDALLRQLNPALKGWCVYFRPGVSSAVFHYLSYYTWLRVGIWLRRKHPKSGWKDLRRRYCDDGWWPASEERSLFNPTTVSTTRYRYRGAVIPTPWPAS